MMSLLPFSASFIVCIYSSVLPNMSKLVRTTVSAAAEEGKNVYVVPGPINQSSYHGSVEIIRNGGIPVYSPEDLIEQLSYNN